MPLTGRRGSRRRRGLITLTATAAAGWAATIAMGAAGIEDHVWLCTLAAAAVCTLAAIQFGLILMLAGLLGGVNERLDRAYGAMAALHRDRPGPDTAATPWRGLHSVGADDVPSLRRVRGGTQGSSSA